MNRLDRVFELSRAEGRAVLMPFLTAGDPDLETTARLVRDFARAGADIIEIGMPFSDPLADGPTIQRSSERALANGVRLIDVWDLAARLRREGLEAPLVLLSYYNPLYRRGLSQAADEAFRAGFDAMVVPDLSLEESPPLRSELEARGLYLIPFLAPTTPDERLRDVLSVARGFVYCVALTGVTGAREKPSEQAGPLLERAHSLGRVPLAVGFGISGPEAARTMGRLAEGVIVGSAVVERIARIRETGEEAVVEFVESLRRALD